MFRKIILPLLAVAGIGLAIFEVVRGDKPPPPQAPFSNAARTPYRDSVAGSGIVEPSSENISIGAPLAGVVSRIFVQIGDDVKVGDPLLAIDDRALKAELAVRQAAVKVAEAQLADANHDLALAADLAAKEVTTIEDREKKRLAAQKAEAQLQEARAELEATETDLARLIVRAPIDGQVLQLKVHPGEFASDAASSAGQAPLLLLGKVTPLNVRVDVDENDAWRVPAGATATGYLRGRVEISTPLKFVRFEPYVVPKKSLTGDSTERVDTRVLQVIFSFERGALPIFVGQQMDVFIEAAPLPASR